MVKKINNLLLFVVILILVSVFTSVKLFSGTMDVACKASFINLFEDVHWEGMFPIEIAGVEIKGIKDLEEASEGLDTNPDKLDSIVCLCKERNKVTIGLTVSYWEPARVVETTKVPFCFPTVGIHLKEVSPVRNFKHTGKDKNTGGGYTSYNSHYYIFNVLDILDLFVDIPCVFHEGFDIAYISEIDPFWNNDLMSFVFNPEAILFGNPVAQLACAADSVSSLAWYPIDALFWCFGSWGSAYPLAGSGDNPNAVEGSALIAAKTVYRQARTGILWDPGINECYRQITPIIVKRHYKMHLVKPVKGPIVPFGRTAVIWEHMKNPPFGSKRNSPDNFSWLLFRKVKCCLGKTFEAQ